MEKFEIVKYNNELILKIKSIEKVINPSMIKDQITKLDNEMSQSTFWDDTDTATKIINENNEYKETLSAFNELVSFQEEVQMMLDLDDEELYNDAENLIKKISKSLHDFEEKLLLSGEYDKNSAIIELHPGAGGTESQDWALMLYRMYKRYSERNNFEFELVDYEEATDAGLKSATFIIKGKNAYGILKGDVYMKRAVGLLILVMLVISLCACDGLPTDNKTEKDNATVSSISSVDIKEEVSDIEETPSAEEHIDIEALSKVETADTFELSVVSKKCVEGAFDDGSAIINLDGEDGIALRLKNNTKIIKHFMPILIYFVTICRFS